MPARSYTSPAACSGCLKSISPFLHKKNRKAYASCLYIRLFSDDRILTSTKLAFGTGYELSVGDTVYNTVCHITKDYYDYYESVQLAIFGNLNPFAQPSPIKSNVRGSANPLGIFTCLVYDRDTTVVRK